MAYCDVLVCYETSPCALHEACPKLPELFVSPSLPIILDGGLGTALERKGLSLKSALWSAEVLSTNSQAIYEVHMDFLKAGADIITTASYQASVEGFMNTLNMSAEKACDLLRSSVRVATQARDDFWSVEENRAGRKKPVVAVSLGSYGAALNNGAEYTGDYRGASLDQLVAFHSQRLDVLLGEEIELLACETIPLELEARALALVLQRVAHIPAWVTFCCKDGESVSSGELLLKCLEPLKGVRNVIGLGVNCTHPSLLLSLVPIVQSSIKSKYTVVYPNSGEVWDHEAKEWRKEVNPSKKVLEWGSELAALKVQMVGGCCRVYPEHITLLKEVTAF